MSGIETRVVQVKFDNAQFAAAIKQTLGDLAKLNTGLKLDNASKGLNDVSSAASRFNLGNMAESVDKISSRFSAMSVVAITALSNITTKAISAGAAMVKSLTIAPITSGFQEYETGLNSVQTILANTQAAGTKLKDVNATLNELNHYSDQTIYNFQEMAKNIGTFTAAGVDLKTATSSIKGIANLAALSGSNSEQASSAMYQLSQAISAGRVSLEDWNSVVNAGMGGTVFQRALAQNAEKIGTLDKGAVKLKGSMKNVTIEGKSFRESITAKPGQESWLTSDVLTKTLAQFTGDLSDAQLKAEGFNEAEIKAIQAQAKTAKNAATQVKTLSQLLDTMRESVGSGWAQTWQIVFGDFTESKKLFTNVNNVLGGYVQASANARNKVLGDWKEMGGRKALIEGIGNAFKALVSVVTPIKEAFREIFPATTGKQLADLSKTIRDFTAGLIIGSDTADKLKRTFAGVFAVFGIGFEVIKAAAKAFVDLFSSATKGSSGFLDASANVGDFLVGLHEAIKNGEGLTKFFTGLANVIKFPFKMLKAFAGLLTDAFGNASMPGLDNLEERFKPLGVLGEIVAKAWSKAVGLMDDVWSKFQEVAPQISDAFSKLMDQISAAFSSGNFSNILDGINTGLFAALVLAIRKFTAGDWFKDAGEGFLSKITEPFESLTDTLGAMQAQLKAGTLLKIAGAIALLTASVVALSLIDSDRLTSALTALSIMFGELLVTMALFVKAISGAGLLQLPLAAAGLVLLATAIDILVVAVYALSKLSWQELAKGLGSVIVLIGALVIAVKVMSGDAAGMVTAGAGLILLAGAIKILASAVKDLAGLNVGEMAKGLGGVAILLTALALYNKFGSANAAGIASGAGIVLLAGGIKILASALSDISMMSWGELIKGLTGMAGGLVLIGTALTLIPPSSILSAAAVLVAATALNLLSVALGSMANMSWEEIAKGLTVLAASLAIIAAAMALMTGALPGAAALLVVAASLAVLAPVLALFGGMSWEEIAKGITVLAAALAVIGVAGLLLTPVVPVLISLGGAIALIGIGALAAGAGVAAFAVGFTALAASGAAGAAAIVAIVATLASAIPVILTQVAKGIGAFAKEIGKAAPEVVAAATKFIVAFLNAIQKIAPKIIQTLLKLITSLLSQLAGALPKMINAGVAIIMALLRGVSQNIGKVVTVATSIIVNFLNSLAKNQGRITDAGVKLIIAFVNGLANAIRAHQAEMNAAGYNLASAIVEGMVKGLGAGAGKIASMAGSIASGALNKAKSVLGIHSPSREFEKIGKYVNQGFLKGLQGNRSDIDTAFKTLNAQLKDLTSDAASEADRLEAKLKKLKSARDKNVVAIVKTTLALKVARQEEARSEAGRKVLLKGLDANRAKLNALAKQYDTVTAKLQTAQQKLDDAIKTRDDYKANITTQYSDLPEITSDTKLADYMDQLKEQIVKTKAFAAMLQKLRKLGLNDTLYKELLAKGTDAMPFVSQLLDSGKAGVTELNGLDSTLESTAANLGKTASNNLYQAAVNSAQGLVDGLKKQQKAIDKVMEQIADAMVAKIKKALKIKSPSRVFAEIGGYAGEGLAVGLKQAGTVVTASAEDVGKNAILAMQKSLSATDKMGVNGIDLNPTIKPVVDLSEVMKGADKISSALDSNQTIAVGATYDQARGAGRSVQDYRDLASSKAESVLPGTKEFNYVQNNYSPKALSSADIYRQTKNQLSKTKGALTS